MTKIKYLKISDIIINLDFVTSIEKCGSTRLSVCFTRGLDKEISCATKEERDNTFEEIIKLLR